MAVSVAVALQRRAIARIDAVVDGYRRTGDIRLPVSELTQAGTELATSNRTLAAASNWPALALGLTKQGHVHRMQAQWPQAVALYQQALDAATRGKDLVLQADALAWLGLAESSRTNLGAAFIFAPDGSVLLVLRGAALIRLGPATGTATPGPEARGVAKLVGIDPGSPTRW